MLSDDCIHGEGGCFAWGQFARVPSTRGKAPLETAEIVCLQNGPQNGRELERGSPEGLEVYEEVGQTGLSRVEESGEPEEKPRSREQPASVR